MIRVSYTKEERSQLGPSQSLENLGQRLSLRIGGLREADTENGASNCPNPSTGIS